METVDIANIALDIILILASLWMVQSVRGIGGVMGRTLTFIVIGAIILGMAHLIASVQGNSFAPWDGTIHRAIVLLGFVFLVIGFRQLNVMKR
jgi:hypothetical protein